MPGLMTEDDFWTTRAALVNADAGCELTPDDFPGRVFRDEDHLRRFLVTLLRFGGCTRTDNLYLPDAAAATRA